MKKPKRYYAAIGFKPDICFETLPVFSRKHNFHATAESAQRAIERFARKHNLTSPDAVGLYWSTDYPDALCSADFAHLHTMAI